MIPKKIHYVWLGQGRKPHDIKRCIKSWKRHMPDFVIKEWNETNFDCDAVPFTREAISEKKYAFAADYIRLYALYTEGGFYFDTDVLVKKTIEPLLTHSFVGGTEAYYCDNRVHYRLEAAIVGAEKNHPFIKDCLDYYTNRHFINSTGLDLSVIQSNITDIAEGINYKRINQNQLLKNDMMVYSTAVFTNMLCFDKEHSTEVFAIHQNAGSWIDYSNRGWLYKFCRSNHLMFFYRNLERLIKR